MESTKYFIILWKKYFSISTLYPTYYYSELLVVHILCYVEWCPKNTTKHKTTNCCFINFTTADIHKFSAGYQII